jgi:hypothetical protein
MRLPIRRFLQALVSKGKRKSRSCYAPAMFALVAKATLRASLRSSRCLHRSSSFPGLLGLLARGAFGYLLDFFL